MDVSGDDIAKVVLKQFDALPAKARPLARGGGMREWVPLSGIVAQGKNSLTCLSMATGMKCLPQDKIARAQGIVLHDWHAEVLAIRSFNRFLLEECHNLISRRKSSQYVRLRSEEERTESHFQPFALQDGVDLHMYCSEAPCGDSSMELTIASQEDSTPWEMPPPPKVVAELSTSPILTDYSTQPTPNISSIESPSTAILHGRGFFSALGTVRRKPSRPDAPPTLSKSCSDKLSLAQSTSLLSSLTALLISPSSLYISSLILPESQYSTTACNRAFSSSGRMSTLKGMEWESGYRFKEFEIKTTRQEFKYSRRQVLQEGEKLVPSNISASWISKEISSVQLETLIGGVLQGRKQYDLRGASRVCKKRMWQLAIEVAALAGVPVIERSLRKATYGEVKGCKELEERMRVKHDARRLALKPWVRNVGGDDFGVEDR